MSAVRLGRSLEARPFQVFFPDGPHEPPDWRLADGRKDWRAGESLPSMTRPPSLVALLLRLMTRSPRSRLFRLTPGPAFQAGFPGDFSSGRDAFLDFLLFMNGLFRVSINGIFDLGAPMLEFLCLTCDGGDQVLVASVRG